MSRKNKAKSDFFKYLGILLIFQLILKIIAVITEVNDLALTNVVVTLNFLNYISWFGGIYILIRAIKLKNDFKNNRIPLIGVILLANMQIINYFLRLIIVLALR